MRKLSIFLAIAVVGVAGCKKAAPTTFIKAGSFYLNYPGGQSSIHDVHITTVSPNYLPTITINGRTVQRDRIETGWGEYYAQDTLPSVSPQTEVELKVTYYNLNDEQKEASAKVKLPPEPQGMALSTNGGEVNVSWNKPDKKNTDFIYVSIDAVCSDGVIYQRATVDTIIADIENVTSVTRSLGSICDEIDPILTAWVFAAVFNMQGPWSGDKDNVKGAKGQYYGGAGKADTASYVSSSSLKSSYSPSFPDADWGKRILKALGKYADEGNWIGM